MILVRPIEPRDRDGWDRLYSGYAAFYGAVQTPAMRDQVFAWLMDHSHEVEGLVAEGQGEPIGLAHFRPFSRPVSATTGGFLDDLFVDPAARGTGAARALIEAVVAEGRKRGWSVVRWLTAADNVPARDLYDRMATLKPLVTYDLKP